MRGFTLCMLLSLSTALLFPLAVSAAPNGSIPLTDSQLFRTKVGKVTYICGQLPPWTVGRMVKGYFYPTSAELRALKKKLRSAKTSAKRAKLEKQIAAKQAYKSAGTKLCRKGPPSTGSKFDSQGNVTQAGKVAFGIPLSMNANVNNGIAAWNMTCRGCHNSYPSSLPLKTYPQILARIQLSPMLFTIPDEVTEQEVADIVAFANFIGSMER